MTRYFIWFIGIMVDYWLYSLISYRLIRKTPRFKARHIILGILFATTLTLTGFSLSFFLSDALLWDFVFRVSILIGIFIAFKILHGRCLLDTLFLTVVTTAITTIVLLPLTFLTALDINQTLIFLVQQSGAILIIILVYKTFKLYELYNMIQRKLLPNILVKQIFLIFCSILLIYSIIPNHEHNLVYHFLFLSALVIFAVILVPTTMNLYQKSMKEMISIHDLYNSLLSTGIAIENINDLTAVKIKFREHCKRFGIDLSSIDPLNNDIKDLNQQIDQFIRLKKEHRGARIEIITDIGYFNDHQRVELQQLLQWLGTLLDNAFDAATKYPVHIRKVVTRTRISLSVANEYLGEREHNFDLMFEKGYSTKGEGRGLGLYHLHQTVLELGGHVTCFEEYQEEYECYFLTVLIEFNQRH